MTPFDEREWQARVRGTACPLCRQTEAAAGHPDRVASLESGHVFLQNDADFRGYCILVHRRHVVELFELSAEERRAFMEDAAAIASAVHAAASPLKINYAMLGNLVPHLHLHIIPRFAADGWWGQSPWARPDTQKRPLTPEAFAALRDQLSAALATSDRNH